MNLKNIDQIQLEGKKVLIRVDFNVPMNGKEIADNTRIVKALPTIKKAIESGAKVILLSHFGRLKVEADKAKKTLKPVATELSNLLNKPVKFIPKSAGQEVKDAVKEMNPGDVVLLENTRFEDLNNKAESGNNPKLAKFWASLGDVFIFDAFGAAHRSHASTVGIAQNIEEVAVGYLVDEEIKKISRALNNPERPAIAIVGGAKVKDKIKTIENLLNKFDRVIIAGGMAYTFFKAQGIEVGNSIVKDDTISESELVKVAREYLKKYQERIVLPIDYGLAPKFENIKPIYNTYNSLEIPHEYQGMDIGPKSVSLFASILNGARTVVWNGPVGVCEFSNYAYGTREIAKIIGSLKGAFTVVGGGDSVAAIQSLGLEKNFSHISTGGGACLAMLEGKKLPVIEVMENATKIKKVDINSDKKADDTNSKSNTNTIKTKSNTQEIKKISKK